MHPIATFSMVIFFALANSCIGRSIETPEGVLVHLPDIDLVTEPPATSYSYSLFIVYSRASQRSKKVLGSLNLNFYTTENDKHTVPVSERELNALKRGGLPKTISVPVTFERLVRVGLEYVGKANGAVLPIDQIVLKPITFKKSRRANARCAKFPKPLTSQSELSTSMRSCRVRV